MLKPSFHQTLQNMLVSDRESHIRQVYDYSNLTPQYFADLYCYLKVVLEIKDLTEQINENFIHLERL